MNWGIMKIGKKSLITGLVALGITLAAAVPANAAAISDWTTGTKSSNYSSSDGSLTWRMTGCTITPARTGPGYASATQQMQLQKSTAVGFSSQGNSQLGCSATHSWSGKGSGTFRFQLNGAYYGSTYYGTAGTYLYSAQVTVGT
jgi:hypothetical protein